MSVQNSVVADKPHIRTFHRAVSNALSRRFIPEKEGGRHSDAFILILSGSTHYRFADYEFTASEGDLLYLARDSIYSMDVLTERYAFIFADFDFDCPDGVRMRSAVWHLPAIRSFTGMFQRLVQKWRLKKTGWTEDCFALLYNIYAELLRTQDSAYLPSDKRRRLDDAVQYISEHFTEEGLDIPAVAAVSGMSESHFRRLFGKAYSMPPVRYIHLLRIDRAKELIRYSDASFTQIAQETGFANLYYFSRMFKKEAGCTPSEYKASCGVYPGV